MGKTLKYVKDFDFNAKPCNYSCGGKVKKYADGGSVAPQKNKNINMVKDKIRNQAPAPQMPPQMPPQPALNNIADAINAQRKAKQLNMPPPKTRMPPKFSSDQSAGRLAAPPAAPPASPPVAPPTGLKKGGAAKMSKVMGEYKSGKLHSGSKKGPVVKSRKQAVAIAMSEAGKSKNRA